MVKEEDIPPAKERRCITINTDKNGKKYYKLSVRPVDESRQMYIKSGQDLDYLMKLRDYIVEQGYTKQEILDNKHKWKTPAREPVVEQYIRRTANGRYGVTKGKSYGVYPTFEEAKMVKEKLIAHDWDEEQVPEIKIRRRNRLGEDRYIFEERGKYIIKRFIKTDDGKLKTERYESSIPTLEEARRLRDEWESIGWDWNNLDLL